MEQASKGLLVQLCKSVDSGTNLFEQVLILERQADNCFTVSVLGKKQTNDLAIAIDIGKK